MNSIIPNPDARRYIYTVVIAVIPILVIAGWVAANDVQTWLNLVAAILGLGSAGLALPNTPGRHEA